MTRGHGELGQDLNVAVRGTDQTTRWGRAKFGAVLLVRAYLNPPTMKEVLAAASQADAERVVCTEMDESTGVITEIHGDGSRHIAEPYRPAEVLQLPIAQVIETTSFQTEAEL